MIKATRAVVLFAVIGVGVGVLAMNGERLRRWASPIPATRAADVPGKVSVGFKDPLDVPAEPLADIGNQPITSIAQRGDAWVAVGMRGLIAIAAAPEGPWRQAVVPVQSDLLSVQFIDKMHGWVVGHDGVILNTQDGGKSWVKQLDGRQLAASFRAFYQQGAGASQTNAAAIVTQLEQNSAAGASLPFRDVLFSDANNGYVVGPFGMIARTSDGGKTWEPLLHQIDNPSSFTSMRCARSATTSTSPRRRASCSGSTARAAASWRCPQGMPVACSASPAMTTCCWLTDCAAPSSAATMPAKPGRRCPRR